MRRACKRPTSFSQQVGMKDKRQSPQRKKDGLQEGKICLKLNTGEEKGVYSFLR